jgi:hypothetical protein
LFRVVPPDPEWRQSYFHFYRSKLRLPDRQREHSWTIIDKHDGGFIGK